MTDALVPAELPIRLAARGIDVLLLVAVELGLGKLMGFGFDWLLLGAAIVLGWFVLFDAFFGATPGKRLVSVRVVGPDGRRPSLGAALVRELFTVVGAIPFVGPLLALAAWIGIGVTASRDPLRQGFHDRWAGTRVVR